MELDGKRIRELREAAFLTQEELAAKAGLGKSTLNRLEQGLQSARISTARKLAAALDVSPAELIRDKRPAGEQ